MKPLKNSWFLNKYLGVRSEYDRPRTVCELGRKIVLRTLMWFTGGVLFAFVAVPPVATAYNLGVMWYTGAGLETVYNDKVPTFAGIMYIIASAELITASIAAAVFGGRWGFITTRDAIVSAMYRYRNKRGYYHVDYVEPETPVRDFIGDLYKRFKDKTCVMLEYQDEIDERRRRDERHAKYIADREAAVAAAKALREADTSKPSKTTEKDDFDDADSHS